MNSNFDQKNEIDIIEFLRYIIKRSLRLFQKFFYYIKLYLQILLINKWIFLGIFLLIGSIAYIVKIVLPKSYKTEAILAVNNIAPKLGQQFIDNFNKFKGDVSYQNTLGISNKAMASIKNVSMTYKEVKDTVSSFFIFNVLLSIKDTNYINEVQDGIVALFKRNSFINKRFQEREERLYKQRKVCLLKLSRIDSLKQIVNRLVIAKNIEPAIYYFNAINPSTLFDAEVSANNELMRIDLALKDSLVEVAQPFFKPERYNEPNIDLIFWKILIWGIPLSLILTPLIGKKMLIKKN